MGRWWWFLGVEEFFLSGGTCEGRSLVMVGKWRGIKWELICLLGDFRLAF